MSFTKPCLSKKFPLVEGVTETVNQIFQDVVHILVLNHRIRGIDRVKFGPGRGIFV